MNTASIFVAAIVVLCVCRAALPVRLPRADSLPSNDECLALSDLSRVAQHQGTDLLARCAALYPQDVELLDNLGAAYESAGKATEAEEVYRRITTLDPGYADVRLRLARLLLRRGAAASARAEAEAALLVQPNRQALLDLLAQTLDTGTSR